MVQKASAVADWFKSPVGIFVIILVILGVGSIILGGFLVPEGGWYGIDRPLVPNSVDPNAITPCENDTSFQNACVQDLAWEACGGGPETYANRSNPNPSWAQQLFEEGKCNTNWKDLCKNRSFFSQPFLSTDDPPDNGDAAVSYTNCVGASRTRCQCSGNTCKAPNRCVEYRCVVGDIDCQNYKAN